MVLGGGYIGLEFAQMFRRFGSRVTVIQRGAQLLPQEDEDIAGAVLAILREDGVDVLLGGRGQRAPSARTTPMCGSSFTNPAASARSSAPMCSPAAGRIPNTDRLESEGRRHRDRCQGLHPRQRAAGDHGRRASTRWAT